MAARTLAESRKVFSGNLEQYVRDHPTTKALLEALLALLDDVDRVLWGASDVSILTLNSGAGQARAAIRLAEEDAMTAHRMTAHSKTKANACHCHVSHIHNVGPRIIRCRLHAAAPTLLERLRETAAHIASLVDRAPNDWDGVTLSGADVNALVMRVADARVAIRLAEGEE